MMRLCRSYLYRIPTQVTDNETAIVHSVTKVDSMEELNDLEKSAEDQSKYVAFVRLKLFIKSNLLIPES